MLFKKGTENIAESDLIMSVIVSNESLSTIAPIDVESVQSVRGNYSRMHFF